MLKKASAKALMAITKTLKDKDLRVRKMAVTALESWGTEAQHLAPKLASLAAHEDSGMRYSAITTLREIEATPEHALKALLLGLDFPTEGKPPWAMIQRVTISTIGDMDLVHKVQSLRSVASQKNRIFEVAR